MDEREQKDLIKIIVLLMLRYGAKHLNFSNDELNRIKDEHPDMLLLVEGSKDGVEIKLEDRPQEKTRFDTRH